jgi:integrase
MEVLGHSEIGVTMNVYAHVLPELRHEAADATDELFGA